jgi:adenylate cyclase
MSAEVHYRFSQNGRLLGEGPIRAPFTVGRQTEPGQATPVAVLDISPQNPQFVANERVPRKLVIVPLSNRAVPRLSLKVDVDGSGNLLARNLHRAVELQLLSGEPLRPNEQLLIGSQCTICFPDEYRLQLSSEVAELADWGNRAAQPGSPAHPLQRTSKFSERKAEADLSNPSTYPKGQVPTPELAKRPQADVRRSFIALDRFLNDSGSESSHLLTMMGREAATNHQELAVRLVRTALEAFKQPPGSKEFFDAAGRAALQMIDLDRVAVLRKEHEGWACRTLSFRPGLDQARAAARGFSHTLLTQMEINGRTTSVDPQVDPDSLWQSMREIDRAVASPIFDENQQIVAALYGDRLMGESENTEPIGELEAALLEVIASGISSSLALQQEQRLRTAMAQFFSPVVLEQLKHDRSLLDGRLATVSVLFCDIRGFSTVTERIGSSQTIAWLNDILTALSECVLAHDGVLVDYIGDELMAMWGAPGEQEDHAERACRAALDMLKLIGPLGEKWKAVVPEGFGLGIGINSGPASVGNTGSKNKFKYGPIGNTVNVASRVQGITKQLGVPGLITGQTAELAQRAPQFQTRRLATVRVVGIASPLDIYQLCQSESQRNLCTRYEEALQAYETGELQLAAGRLAALVQDYPDDRPTIILLSRAVELLTQPDRDRSPVWSLTQK